MLGRQTVIERKRACARARSEAKDEGPVRGRRTEVIAAAVAIQHRAHGYVLREVGLAFEPLAPQRGIGGAIAHDEPPAGWHRHPSQASSGVGAGALHAHMRFERFGTELPFEQPAGHRALPAHRGTPHE